MEHWAFIHNPRERITQGDRSIDCQLSGVLVSNLSFWQVPLVSKLCHLARHSGETCIMLQVRPVATSRLYCFVVDDDCFVKARRLAMLRLVAEGILNGLHNLFE